MMRILVTGRYDASYNRNLVLLEGLRSLSEAVVLDEFPYEARKTVNRQELAKRCAEADWVFLPAFTHLDVPFIRKLTAKPIAFDPLISRYLTKVFDFKQVWKYSPRALKNYWKDWVAFRHSDVIFADTEAHRQYFMGKFNVPGHKVHVLPVGVDVSNFYPKPQADAPNGAFVVGFYGGFIPLQGVLSILKAAALLRDEEGLRFELIGDGFELQAAQRYVAKEGLQQVSLAGHAPYHTLNDRINAFDIALGIFGATPKAALVVPNKVYHYAACGKAIITKDTPAIREVFDAQSACLVEGSPESIAQAVLDLRADAQRRTLLGERALACVKQGYGKLEVAHAFLHALQGAHHLS